MKKPNKQEIIAALESTPSERWQEQTLMKLRTAVQAEETPKTIHGEQQKETGGMYWLRALLTPKVLVPIGTFGLTLVLIGTFTTIGQNLFSALDHFVEKGELALAEVSGDVAVAETHLAHAAERVEELKALVEESSDVAVFLLGRTMAAGDDEGNADPEIVEQASKVVDSYEVSLESVQKIFGDFVHAERTVNTVQQLAAIIFTEDKQFEDELLSIQQNADMLFQAYISEALSETEELRDATLQGVIRVADGVNEDLRTTIDDEVTRELGDLGKHINELDALVAAKDGKISPELLLEAETLLLSATENFHQAEQKLKENNFPEAFNALNIAESFARQSEGLLTAEENTKAFQLKALEMLQDMQQEILQAQAEINDVSSQSGNKAAEQISRLQIRLQQAQGDLAIVQKALEKNDLDTLLETVAEIQELTAVIKDGEITPYERARLVEAAMIQAKTAIAVAQTSVDSLPAEEEMTLGKKRELVRIRRIYLEAQQLFQDKEYLRAEEKADEAKAGAEALGSN